MKISIKPTLRAESLSIFLGDSAHRVHPTFWQLRISPRQAPLPRGKSALSPPLLQRKLTGADVVKMT